MNKYEDLVKEAFEAMKNAYAPYSNYHVGACVLLKNGKTFKGANIENCSYAACICAERSAIFATYSNGYRKDDIEAIAIAFDGNKIGTPCGVSRQVLSELLNEDTPIILSNGKDEMITNIKELLPHAFSIKDIDK